MLLTPATEQGPTITPQHTASADAQISSPENKVESGNQEKRATASVSSEDYYWEVHTAKGWRGTGDIMVLSVFVHNKMRYKQSMNNPMN